jgi:hypothetical protein
MAGLLPTFPESASIQDYSDILIGGIGMFDKSINVYLWLRHSGMRTDR